MEKDSQEGEKTDSESTSLIVDYNWNKALGTFDSELAILSSFSVILQTYY
jgi:hypothetical protein